MSTNGKQPLLHPAEIAKLELEAKKLEIELKQERIKLRGGQIDLRHAERLEKDRLANSDLARSLYFGAAVMPANTDRAIDTLMTWARRDPGEPIVIYFNTPGGSVVDGLALYDVIQRVRRAGHHVTTHAIGMAASMGAVLMQAGTERVMDARAKMLIHKGSLQVSGSVEAVEDRIKFSDMLREDLFDILAERSTLSKKQIINRADRKDWWFGAAEALKLGFIDRVE